MNDASAGQQFDFLRNSKIGKFGEMILQHTNPRYRVGDAKPIARHQIPEVEVKVEYAQAAPPSNIAIRPRSSGPPPPIVQNQRLETPQPKKQQLHRSPSFAVEVAIPSKNGTLHQAPKAGGNRLTPEGSQQAAIVIPPPPPKFDPSQYVEIELRQTMPLGTTPSSKSRKRKRSTEDGDDEPMATGIDQRAKADSHVRALEAFIGGIFEAEDNLQPDTSDRHVDKASKYWLTGTLEGDSPCLSSAVQVKLENAIYRVIGVGRFTRIDLDDLTRLQKLCESTLKLAADTKIKVEEEMATDESAADAWLGRVSIVDNGLKTAKTVLRIMVGGREEKQVSHELSILCTYDLTSHRCITKIYCKPFLIC